MTIDEEDRDVIAYQLDALLAVVGVLLVNEEHAQQDRQYRDHTRQWDEDGWRIAS